MSSATTPSCDPARRRFPEILRLAPNLEVAQLNATSYAISARGFNVGNNASLSDKLLVLIDGRSVYTPLFAGVYWDMQEVPVEDIDRIEVISGPGGTLYGANAVNGVINIITRDSAATQGGVIDAGVGTLENGTTLQYGGRAADNLTYRAYGEGYWFGSNETASGGNAHDSWNRPQGGFRIDWGPAAQQVAVSGDIYHATDSPSSGLVAGQNLNGRWQRRLDNGSSLQVQAYYDNARRFAPDDGGGFGVDTYDINVQHRFTLGGWNDVTWGAEERITNYAIENQSSLLFEPDARTLNLSDAFLQDVVALSDSVKATVGLKLEDEPYTGIQPLPSVRIAWKATSDVLLWSAVSRAVRAPTPVDRDLVELSGTTPILVKSFNFQPEELIAYEAGTRLQLSPRASLSISAYSNDYDNLRSVNTTPGGFLPLRWGNGIEAHTYGVEIWGEYSIADWWRIGPALDVEREDIRATPGSTDIGGAAFVADDPNHQASLHSSMDLGKTVTWDAYLRNVGALPNPEVPQYTELNTRLGWKVTPALELSLSGFNLLHARHEEFVEAGTTDEVPRSFFLEARLTF